MYDNIEIFEKFDEKFISISSKSPILIENNVKFILKILEIQYIIYFIDNNRFIEIFNFYFIVRNCKSFLFDECDHIMKW